MWLRISFWVNKFVNLLHMPRQERHDKPVVNFELLGTQKMQVKSIVLFLKYQQDMLERLLNMNVSEVNDFEW